MKQVFFSVFLMLGIVACSGGGGGVQLTAAEQFVSNLNYEDPYNDFYLAKDPTLFEGYIIVEDLDGFWAIDIEDAARWADYDYDVDFYYDHSFEVVYVGNGYYEDSYGNLFQQNAGTSKDLEKLGGIMEKAKVKAIGEQLAENYGLSESRGIEVAKLVSEWKNLSATRSLTNADADAFSEELLGFSLTSAMDAYKKHVEGDEQALEDLISQAATANGTSPEHMNELVGEFLVK